MKIKHRVPLAMLGKSAEISPEYQAELDRTAAKAEAAYNRALKRLQAAELRLSRAQRKQAAPRQHKRQIAELEAMVQLRRIELQKWHMLMVATPASSMHRGTAGGHRHVPSPGVF
jgi:hypothetical protein